MQNQWRGFFMQRRRFAIEFKQQVIQEAKEVGNKLGHAASRVLRIVGVSEQTDYNRKKQPRNQTAEKRKGGRPVPGFSMTKRAYRSTMVKSRNGSVSC